MPASAGMTVEDSEDKTVEGSKASPPAHPPPDGAPYFPPPTKRKSTPFRQSSPAG